MEDDVRIMGHPVHPILVPFPIGLLTTSVIFDIVYMITGGGRWAVISFWMIAAGVIGGLLAAVFGLIDWRAIPPGTRAKSVGLLHASTNALMVALFAISWLLRLGAPGEPGGLAIVLSFAGVGLISFGGYLGGELVFRMGVGVSEGANLDARGSLSGRPADEGAARGRRVE
ncbi:MAG: DUF2231 domain-containing protein [Actinomycetota bacterium]|nr:DUF2231 domain-containing protein [Actinomycetota bacterium]